MKNHAKKKPRLLFIYFATFVTIIGFGMVFPLLPFYAREFQASELTIGLLAASFAIGEFFFAPFWGRLSDRFGRKPIILLALIGVSLAFLSFALANNLLWLFISRFLQGVFSSATFTSASAYVADVTGRNDRIKGMSRLGASVALGFIFGPAIGGTLSSVNHQMPFFAASALAFLNFILVLAFLPESLSKKAEILVIKEGFLNIRQMYHGLRGELAALFILIFLWSYGMSNNQVTIPLFGAEVLLTSATLIGIFFSLQGAASALVQWFFLSKIAQKIGEHHTAVLGLSIMALSLFLMPFSPSALVLAALMMIASFGSAITRPTVQTLISKKTHEGQGTTMGIAASFESMGRIIGPISGGLVFYSFGYHAAFLMVVISIAAMLIYVVFKKKFLKPEVKSLLVKP
ncbi:MFS transporter [Candidatus Daviesbacteria bacterium]|nr:MFS transporter [Candidatus Daviesbacteria bacterium]